jgi:hypothetical protein
LLYLFAGHGDGISPSLTPAQDKKARPIEDCGAAGELCKNLLFEKDADSVFLSTHCSLEEENRQLKNFAQRVLP